MVGSRGVVGVCVGAVRSREYLITFRMTVGEGWEEMGRMTLLLCCDPNGAPFISITDLLPTSRRA